MNSDHVLMAAVLAVCISTTAGITVGEAIQQDWRASAFDKACAMDRGTVQHEFICVVNGKAVLFN